MKPFLHTLLLLSLTLPCSALALEPIVPAPPAPPALLATAKATTHTPARWGLGNQDLSALEIEALAKKTGITAGQHERELRAAAFGGDPYAQYLMAVAEGINYWGGSPTSKMRMHWLQQAADQGLVRARHDLGVMMLQQGVEQEKAVTYIAEAAQSGNAAALMSLALLLDKFPELAKSPDDAALALKQSAWRGFGPAQLEMAKQLYGVTPRTADNIARARQWLDKAVAQDVRGASQMLLLISKTTE